MAIEVFANQPFTSVTAGGTTNSDTSFTVSSSSAFPAASNSTTPPTSFRIQDPNQPGEIMLVTNVSGTTWTVTRGIEGVAVAHTSPWTAYQVITAGTLQGFKQAPSILYSPTTVTSTTETVLAVYTVPTVDLINGTMWEIMAWGPLSGNGATHPIFKFTLYWGGTGSVGGTYTIGSGAALCNIKSGTNTVANTTTMNAGGSFDLLGNITLLSSTTVTANLNMWWNNATALTTAVVSGQTTNNANGTNSTGTAVTITAGGGPIFLTGYWPTVGSAQTFTATSPSIYRAS